MAAAEERQNIADLRPSVEPEQPLAEAVERVRKDARMEPAAYQADTEVPAGGE